MERRGRGPQNLTPDQEVALLAVERADKAWRDAKLYLEAKLRKALQEELRKFSEDRDEAVYNAHKAGVPKARIGRDGLHTTSPNAPYDAIKRYMDQHEAIEVERYEKPKPLYEWEQLETHGDITFWALHDTTTDHSAGIVKNDFYPATITVENGWLYARNTDKHVGMWLDGEPSLEVVTWAEANEPW